MGMLPQMARNRGRASERTAAGLRTITPLVLNRAQTTEALLVPEPNLGTGQRSIKCSHLKRLPLTKFNNGLTRFGYSLRPSISKAHGEADDKTADRGQDSGALRSCRHRHARRSRDRRRLERQRQ